MDVGCGTGELAAALARDHGARVWAVDPSEEMLAVARAKAPQGVGFKLARAEELPFKDGWFERAVLSLVVHLVERARAFAEARRVLGPEGRLAIATFDPAHFAGYWLNDLFPSLEAIDRARFPSGEELADELGRAGFADVRLVRLGQRATIEREAALERIRGRHISTFQLLAEEEYAAGLERAERELPDRIEYPTEHLLAFAR